MIVFVLADIYIPCSGQLLYKPGQILSLAGQYVGQIGQLLGQDYVHAQRKSAYAYTNKE